MAALGPSLAEIELLDKRSNAHVLWGWARVFGYPIANLIKKSEAYSGKSRHIIAVDLLKNKPAQPLDVMLAAEFAFESNLEEFKLSRNCDPNPISVADLIKLTVRDNLSEKSKKEFDLLLERLRFLVENQKEEEKIEQERQKATEGKKKKTYEEIMQEYQEKLQRDKERVETANKKALKHAKNYGSLEGWEQTPGGIFAPRKVFKPSGFPEEKFFEYDPNGGAFPSPKATTHYYIPEPATKTQGEEEEYSWPFKGVIK